MKQLPSLFFLIIMSFSCTRVEQTKEPNTENKEDIPIAFIQKNVLSKSESDKNIVFILGGKSCFICIEEIVSYVNNFDPKDYYINIVSNSPALQDSLTLNMQTTNYQNFDQITLEKHGYTMANCEILVFENNELIHKNTLIQSQFDAINKKIDAL